MKPHVTLVLLLLLLLAAGAFAEETIRIEAEDFTNYDPMGSGSFRRDTDSHASNNASVQEFNIPGQWIEVAFHLDSDFCFETGIWSAGEIGLVRTWYVEYRFQHNQVVVGADTLITPEGQGAG